MRRGLGFSRTSRVGGMIATDPIECVWLSGGSVRVTLFAVLGEVESLVFDILRDTASH